MFRINADVPSHMPELAAGPDAKQGNGRKKKIQGQAEQAEQASNSITLRSDVTNDIKEDGKCIWMGLDGSSIVFELPDLANTLQVNDEEWTRHFDKPRYKIPLSDIISIQCFKSGSGVREEALDMLLQVEVRHLSPQLQWLFGHAIYDIKKVKEEQIQVIYVTVYVYAC